MSSGIIVGFGSSEAHWWLLSSALLVGNDGPSQIKVANKENEMVITDASFEMSEKEK